MGHTSLQEMERFRQSQVVIGDLSDQNLIKEANSISEEEEKPPTKSFIKASMIGSFRMKDTTETIDNTTRILISVVVCNLVHEANLSQIRQIFSGLKDDVASLQDYDFRTPLHIAAGMNRVEIAVFLINRGAKVNAQDRWKRTPLFDAVTSKHKKITKILIEHGAKLGLQDLELALHLNRVVVERDIEQLHLLVQAGVDLNVSDYDDRTPLHVAGDLGHSNVWKYLIEKGANPKKKDVWGNLPTLNRKEKTKQQ